MKTLSKGTEYRFQSFRPVVVTGIGIISTAGNSAPEFEQSLRDGRSGIGYLEGFTFPDGQPCIGAEVIEERLYDVFRQYDQTLFRRAGRLFKISGKSIKASALAGAEAWLQAGMDRNELSEDRIGIVVAGNNISPAVSYNAMQECRNDLELVHPRYALSYMDTNQLGVLSELFGIKGEGVTVGGASASGNAAILKATQMIQLGIVDACMVIGAMAELSPLELQGFINIGAYGGRSFRDAPGKACRPFDKDHEGFIFGQASCCLILEGADSASARQADVLATVAGGAACLDGHSLSDPNEDGQVRTMEKAIRTAGIHASSIDYINAHGTSTPLGDLTELRSIGRVFGGYLSDVVINSTKAITGHCLYAAGVVEAAATIIQLKAGFLHPQINLDIPVSREHCFAAGKMEPANFTYGLSNSYGFGGINTSVIFKKGEC
ncbi:beta-ketoacyl synthase N-terminal-like domain-containing protein [Paenibacillus sp. BR2-3]|uniref:beta-ketoacyl synthase N-terminal-like domain-containing protein n=1 Tax=Paenibacillus sp. BR2-3 TaxID=3048494 RepID=UPI0039775FD8